MTNTLREAFERAQGRTEEEQNSIAELILRELEGQEWEVSDAAREAIEEARAESASGDSMAYRGVCAHPPRRHRKLLPYRVYL